MQISVRPDRSAWKGLCARPSEEDGVIRSRVEAIIARVRDGGDAAIAAIEEEISGRKPTALRVSDAEIEEAARELPPALKEAIRDAAANIRSFHEAQLPAAIDMMTAPGVRCIQKPVPIENVGLYIPGGTAPLFSTVLMLAIPAMTAGCRRVVLCTPAGTDGRIAPAVLYAASFCGVKDIFRTGGAQAIAAMACGTETIPKADKIFGPGNRYVTTAKQILAGSDVAIDMPAGPSEVMVIDGGTSPASFIAADLLSQAEHGRDSQVMLVCTSCERADEVNSEVDRQLRNLSRSELAGSALGWSRAVVLDSTEDIIAFANTYAPEHLIISTGDPWKIADGITAAGSVFVGPYTPESAGDYASGTNHTLPTCGWARSHSGVNIDSFMRKMTIQEITREGLEGLSATIIRMAEAEGLQAHANAVKTRLGK